MEVETSKENHVEASETVADAPTASQSSETVGWYILDENSQHLGPYDVPTLEGILPSQFPLRFPSMQRCRFSGENDVVICEAWTARYAGLIVTVSQAMPHTGMSCRAHWPGEKAGQNGFQSASSRNWLPLQQRQNFSSQLPASQMVLPQQLLQVWNLRRTVGSFGCLD